MSVPPQDQTDPSVIHQKVLSLIDEGKKLIDSCKKIGNEIGKVGLLPYFYCTCGGGSNHNDPTIASETNHTSFS